MQKKRRDVSERSPVSFTDAWPKRTSEPSPRRQWFLYPRDTSGSWRVGWAEKVCQAQQSKQLLFPYPSVSPFSAQLIWAENMNIPTAANVLCRWHFETFRKFFSEGKNIIWQSLSSMSAGPDKRSQRAQCNFPPIAAPWIWDQVQCERILLQLSQTWTFLWHFLLLQIIEFMLQRRSHPVDTLQKLQLVVWQTCLEMRYNALHYTDSIQGIAFVQK